jgi:hypothetical protein
MYSWRSRVKNSSLNASWSEEHKEGSFRSEETAVLWCIQQNGLSQRFFLSCDGRVDSI